MRTITIGNAPSLTKDYYENEMELSTEIEAARSTDIFELTEEQKKMLRERSAEAKKNGFKGLTKQEFWASIEKHNA